MIYVIANRIYPICKKYKQVSFSNLLAWLESVNEYQLDIETNVVDDITEREIYVIQFGSVNQPEGVQWVLDFASFNSDQIAIVITILNTGRHRKLIHNAVFEYTVIKYCLGIDINNLYCTMLALKVTTNGVKVDDGFYSLAGAIKYFLDINISKEEQTTFTGSLLTEKQILYAAHDVVYLDVLKRSIEQMQGYNRITILLENAVVRAFGDILVNGFDFDQDLWRENIAWATPKVEEAKEEVFQSMTDNFYESCCDLGFINAQDTVDLNWNSTDQKKLFFQEVVPTLASVNKPGLKSLEAALPDTEPLSKLVNGLLVKDYDLVDKIAIAHFRPVLEKINMFTPKGKAIINLNSPQQRLKLFQLIDPALDSTKEEVLSPIGHPLIKSYLNYISTSKLLSSYGDKWFSFVGLDGKIRPRFVDQILDTGRSALSKPGMMTIPADEGYKLGDRYRMPFKPTPGYKIVATDFASQELAIIAYLANEEVWLDAIQKGKDLHSICGALVFKDAWVKAGGHPEGLEKPPKGSLAEKLRSFVKTISFGLAYGGGPKMLMSRLGITETEAKELIIAYFTAFPKLKTYFETRAALALRQGYIETAPPYNRRRYFPDWDPTRMSNSAAAAIERQGKNTSIQGSGADGSKSAMVEIKYYIETHSLQDRVRILFMLHDAVVTEARSDFAEQWADIQNELMIKGHTYNIPNRIIGAETKITDYWTK